MIKFRITYRDEDGELETHDCEFATTVEPDGRVLLAQDWAEDLAYSLARKG